VLHDWGRIQPMTEQEQIADLQRKLLEADGKLKERMSAPSSQIIVKLEKRSEAMAARCERMEQRINELNKRIDRLRDALKDVYRFGGSQARDIAEEALNEDSIGE